MGMGIPIPILDEGIAESVGISDEDIYTTIYDYSVQRRDRPTYGRVNYKQLRSGAIRLNGNKVLTNPVCSYAMAREISQILKSWIQKGEFFLTKPYQSLSHELKKKALNE